VLRDKHFSEGALRGGALLQPGWWQDAATPPRRQEQPAAIAAWLTGLPKPCGVFTCCDSWARVVSRYAGASGLRVPEDLALVGVDNDLVECQLMVPPLSSVAVPWRSVGESAARLVSLGLNGTPIAGNYIKAEGKAGRMGARLRLKASVDLTRFSEPVFDCTTTAGALTSLPSAADIA